ncbi:MAG: RecQ family ATP-dependent DNA helicase [Pirellulaceae bacterium]|nr:RecQ family ATP-dependent DNA helicase [Pirellulaceae bacterium]
MDAATEIPDLDQHLSRFGLASFRPGQRDVIAAVLARQDCLCIMPTGGGKSLCYQLPSVAREGVTLVVSPLIALMKDQVDALAARGIAATCINSTLSPSEQFERMDGMAAGQFDLVYIAPERLRSSAFLEKLRATNLQLLAVDEAHCISEWGHDFRPDYARLGLLRQRLGFPPTIALTATATPEVRADVAKQLQLRDPRVFITGFARPNLHFGVREAYSEVDKDQSLLDFLNATPGAGIVYAATRKKCEELAELLRLSLPNRRAGLYHAGLEAEERHRVQEAFMEGRSPLIVATNAFGMGIDKADLRFVVHYNLPGTLEAYYQEAGRAGRDGLHSQCLLLYSSRDRRIQEFFIDSKYPAPETVEQVYDYLRKIDQDPIELTLEEIRERLGLNIRSDGVAACEKLLEGCGALERLDSRQNMAGVKIDSDLPTLVDLLPREAKVQWRVLRAIEAEIGELRGERVFVNPRKLAAAAEVDSAALTRALRELAKLQAFDYVPPFRGRAVHMLERHKPFHQLGIDFAEQQRRRDAEYKKLDRMVAYATARRCRQVEILDYFGDPSRAKCGLCDNCGGSAAGAASADQAAAEQSPELVEAVRIVLSGVARTQGRFGKRLVAGMLIGSESAKVTKVGMQRHSTYGLLKHLSEDETLELIDALLRLRLLQQVELQPHRPLLQLTPRGQSVMKGDETLTETLVLGSSLASKLHAGRPGRKPAAKAPAKPVEKTAEKPSVKTPPSQPTKTPTKTPTATPTPTKLSPMSPAPTEREADFDPFAEVNAEFDAPDEFVVPRAAPQPADASHPPHYWTWRVLQSGLSAIECQHARGLDAETIFDHVLRAARDGHPVCEAWLLSPRQITLLEQLIGNQPPQKVRSLLANLPAELKFRDVQLYLHARGLSG